MQPIGDDWVVTMEWPDGVEDGGPARLVIEPIGRMPVGGLSSTVLRRINFRSAIENVREQIAASERRNSEHEAIREFEREQLRTALREGITEAYLALLSWHYVQAAERGQANINNYLAEMLGKPVGTVRGHLIRARHDGLLSGSHGRKGGELSPEAQALIEPYAKRWLDEMDKIVHGNRAHIAGAET
ncbi:hypothetical protein GCM10027535_34230 [Mycolicibacterium hippocampi]|uniref:Uncharacterized protein n=2 Tax=Mycolicibacterium hippocampi TaxID=659824 RepID=A0A7I9ZIX6_9MYCO|nr:hypothetical protein MHIP_14580 [Mycolicibacterium hippocampi]